MTLFLRFSLSGLRGRPRFFFGVAGTARPLSTLFEPLNITCRKDLSTPGPGWYRTILKSTGFIVQYLIRPLAPDVQVEPLQTGEIQVEQTAKIPKTMSVPEAGERYFGLSRNGSYEAARRGDIPTIQVGRLKRVSVAVMERIVGQG